MTDLLRCSKCHSTGLTLQRLSAHFGSATRILSCRCGKQFFDDQIEELVAQQPSIEASAGATAAAKLRRRRQEEDAADAAIREETRRQRDLEAKRDAERRLAEFAAWKAINRPAPPEPTTPKCAIPTCQEHARENSKYCSRLCNNRNARTRAKQRARATVASIFAAS